MDLLAALGLDERHGDFEDAASCAQIVDGVLLSVAELRALFFPATRNRYDDAVRLCLTRCPVDVS